MFSVIRLYRDGTGLQKDKIATLLSISMRTINNHLSDVDKRIKEDRNQKIFDMFMAGYTQEEIAKEVNLSQKTISEATEVLYLLENLPKSIKLLALFQDPDFTTPIYNLWNFAKLTNGTSHPGNSEGYGSSHDNDLLSILSNL